MLTIIESPFAGDFVTNTLYLKRAVLHCISRNEVPFASHGFFTHFLDDNNPDDRNLGITLGYRFWEYARIVAFYTDYGMSSGMFSALENCKTQNMPYELRSIGKNDANNPD